MDWHSIGQVVFIFVLSALKFGFGGVPAAVFAKFPFFKAVTITTGGGVAGAILFANISQWALDTWHKFRVKYFPYHKHKPNAVTDSKFAHMVKEKWGLTGIAFFTPFILSIPIGTALAVHFYRDKQKVISYMLISIAAWDVVLYFFYNNFYHVVVHYFHQLFHS
jgi:hypothetical protein